MGAKGSSSINYASYVICYGLLKNEYPVKFIPFDVGLPEICWLPLSIYTDAGDGYPNLTFYSTDVIA